jgi:hypothetical protein
MCLSSRKIVSKQRPHGGDPAHDMALRMANTNPSTSSPRFVPLSLLNGAMLTGAAIGFRIQPYRAHETT